MIDLGDTYELAAECRNAAGGLADATIVSLTVTKPDGTVDVLAPANPPVVAGSYTYPYVTTQPGRHTVVWSFTGGVPAQASSDVFDVASASPVALVSLAAAKKHLGIPLTVTVHDEKLRGLIASITDVIEGITGTVVRRTFVETYSGRGEPALVLLHRPVVSVTSVTEDGVTVPPADYSAASSGLLTRVSGYRASGQWADGIDNIVVTYEAGRALVPASVLDGSLDLIRINWRPQAGGNSSVFDQGRSDDYGQRAEPGEMRLGFFVPNTVMQRLKPSERPPLVA